MATKQRSLPQWCELCNGPRSDFTHDSEGRVSCGHCGAIIYQPETEHSNWGFE